jgi:hypothetical protein
MLNITLLSRVTFSTVSVFNRHCFELYTHFSRLLLSSAVRFPRGGKRQSGYGSLSPGPLSIPTGPQANPWRERESGAQDEPEKGKVARRGTPRRPDPKQHTARYAPPVRPGATRKEKEIK